MAVAPVIEATVQMLRPSLPPMVALELSLPSTTVLVEADETQLGQVLLNLCTNAWHAVEEGEGMAITIGLATTADSQAHLWVADTGPGMDSSTSRRIFDPFFTTKPSSRGTGLGLGIARTIVEAHGGTISVESSPGQGATFHVFLPLAPAVSGSEP